MSGSRSGGGGPCGACKFLRRKCVAECVFAPYFDSEQGSAHFAAVHKVFGASNASKLLTMIPASQRMEAIVTLTYEALARLRDPVYGCVAHIFALQHQVMSLQAELAYVETHLSMLQQRPEEASSSNASVDNKKNVSSTTSLQIDRMSQQAEEDSTDLSRLFGVEEDPVEEEGDLNALARHYISMLKSSGSDSKKEKYTHISLSHARQDVDMTPFVSSSK